jgi:hypothetical protein
LDKVFVKVRSTKNTNIPEIRKSAIINTSKSVYFTTVNAWRKLASGIEWLVL